MTRFACFTNKELDAMEYGFNIALDNTGLDTPQQILKKLIHEIRAERGLREKEETERHKALHEGLKRAAMNSNYGIATSCCDDEKLVVLCMINKQLREIEDTLAKLIDKI